MQRIRMLTGLVVFGLSATGCAYTTTAKDWNGLHGADGQPTYYASTMKVGLNLLCAIPFLGDMGISGLTTDLTGDIKRAGHVGSLFLWLPPVHLGGDAGHQHRCRRIPPGSRDLCEGSSGDRAVARQRVVEQVVQTLGLVTPSSIPSTPSPTAARAPVPRRARRARRSLPRGRSPAPSARAPRRAETGTRRA
jgi:hypothetical protein